MHRSIRHTTSHTTRHIVLEPRDVPPQRLRLRRRIGDPALAGFLRRNVRRELHEHGARSVAATAMMRGIDRDLDRDLAPPEYALRMLLLAFRDRPGFEPRWLT